MSEPALKARAQNTEDEPAVFIVRRAYRWVRHPWYLVAIMLFWSCVDFTSDLAETRQCARRSFR